MTSWQQLVEVAKPEPDPAPAGSRPSAVLVGLIDHEQDGPSVILTRRADHLRHHAGQISFPGGRIEAAETPAEAAMREAFEEITLARECVEVIGYLPGVVTTAGFHIAPVLGRVTGDLCLTPDPDEVDRILIEPVLPLLNPANHLSVMRDYQGKAYQSWTIRHDHEYIWGATARLIVQWARLLYPQPRKEREA